MKAFGCVFLVLILLVASFAALFALRNSMPEELGSDPHIPHGVEPTVPPTVAPQKPPPDPNKYETWVDSLHEFSRTDNENSFLLHYGFIDHNGMTRHIACEVSRNDQEQESATFGYRETEMWKTIDAQLVDYVNEEIEKRNLAGYFKISIHGRGAYEWHSEPSRATTIEESERVRVAVDDLDQFLEKNYDRKRDELENAQLAMHGFVVRKNFIEIDHGAMVLRSQKALENCFEALMQSADDYNQRQYIGLFLAFFQEIRYEMPPDTLNGKYILGLYVPTEVLINNHGDCDSKSLAFSAMMRSFGLPVVVIDLPHHVLVGVATRPGPGQDYVQIGNRYFVLCEVAGPAKLSPGEEGETKVSGYFEYTLVEPMGNAARWGESKEGATRD